MCYDCGETQTAIPSSIFGNNQVLTLQTSDCIDVLLLDCFIVDEIFGKAI